MKNDEIGAVKMSKETVLGELRLIKRLLLVVLIFLFAIFCSVWGSVDIFKESVRDTYLCLGFILGILAIGAIVYTACSRRG